MINSAEQNAYTSDTL